MKEELYPSFPERNVVIALTSSNEYVPYCGVLIQSILDSSHIENNYDILILETDVTEENRRLLASLISGHQNFSLRFVDVSDYFQNLSFEIHHEHYTVYAYYRLAIPYVLSHYEKAIYLDSDIVVLSDLAELMRTDIRDFYAAAVPSARVLGVYNQWKATGNERYYRDVTAHLKNPYHHFASGTLLLNLNAVRSAFPDGGMIKTAASREWRIVDEDVLNYLFDGKVYFLPQTWGGAVPSKKNKEQFAPAEVYDEWREAIKNPKLYHYVGKMLPVDIPDVFGYPFFWAAARKTPFYEVLLARMTENIAKNVIKRNK